MNDSSNQLMFQFLELIIPILVAVAFAKSVQAKIKAKEDFSGMGWGLVNGIIGIGILWVIIAHGSINKEIIKIKNKKYKKYAELQMKDFTKTYGICLAIWIVILFIVITSGIYH